jgi:glycine dehydrogenase subunit 1
MHEIEITRRFQQRALEDSRILSFIGAGAYHHHIPPPVSLQSNPFAVIAGRGTAASRVSELVQSLSGLNAMSATHIAGGDLISAMVKGIEIIQKTLKRGRTNRILVASTVNPFYRKAIKTRLKHQGVDLDIVRYNEDTGAVGLDHLSKIDKNSADALIVQYPNFFGVVENVDEISNWAFNQGIPLMAIVNPLALGALKASGKWGKRGAEMAIYDLQTLGLPTCLSGSIATFISIKQRLINKFSPADKSALAILKGQHVDNWMLARANAYLNYQGDIGLTRIAQQCARNLLQLESSLLEIPLLSARFSGNKFHESVIEFDRVNLAAVVSLCAREGLQIGYPLESEYPELGRCLLLNATEAHLPDDIGAMVGKLSKNIELQSRTV